MATRKQLWHPDEVKQKIQASQLINRLMAHIESDKPLMDSSQVTAATKLLNKVLPDLSSTKVDGALDFGLRDILKDLDGRGRGLPADTDKAGE